MSRTLSHLILIYIAAGSSLIGAGLMEMNPPDQPEIDKTIAYIGGRLVDGNGGIPVENAVVIIRGSTIIDAGPISEIEIPNTADRVDVSGYTVLPGLIDTHFHSKNDLVRPITYELEKGITSFRDPGHPWKYYQNVFQANLTMPRIFMCGGHLDGTPPVWPDQAVVPGSRAETREAVNRHVDRGATSIKVYFRLPLEFIAAACEAAADRGVLVTSHLELVDADDAIRAGVRGVEHISSFGTTIAMEKDVAQFKSQIYRDSNARRSLRPWLWSRIDLEENPRVQPLLDLIVETGTFVSPTIALFEARSGEKNATEEHVKGFANMKAFLRKCHQAGAKIVVGSHTNVPFADRGYAYQREMEILVETGMTPLEVLTSATKFGAEFFGIEDRLGTLAPDKVADLIMVKGDPTKDIIAMRDPQNVMLNGSWVVGGSF